MRLFASSLLLGSALLLPSLGCDSAPPEATAKLAASPEQGSQAAPAPSAASLAGRSFGSPPGRGELVQLTDLLHSPERFGEKTVRTEGLVTAVCKSMGCWMELGDSAGKVHVKMAGHAFLVPKTSSGHRATVEGKVVPAAPPACGDGCREPGAGPQASLELEASGVTFLD